MVTSEDVLRQREAYARAQSQVRQARSRLPTPTQQTLRQQTQPLVAREERRGVIIKGEQLTQAERDIATKSREFERTLAKRAPSLAKPEVLKNVAKEARQEIGARITELYNKAAKVETKEARAKFNREAEALQKSLRRLTDKQVIGFVEAGMPLKQTYSSRSVYGLLPGQEFTQKEIGEAFQMSIDPSLLTKQQKSILQGRKYFADVTKQAEFRTSEIERYKTAGYSSKEATALAEYSIREQRTPGPQESNRYLVNQGVKAPKWYSPRIVEYGIKKGVGYVETGIDTGLKKVGVPEKYRGFYASYTPVKTTDLFKPRAEGTKVVAGSYKESTRILPTEREVMRTSKITPGKTVRTGLDLGLWVTPYVGEARAVSYVAGTGEKIITKEPVTAEEILFGTVLLGAGVFKGARSLKKRTATEERIVQTGLPKTEQLIVFDPKIKTKLFERSPSTTRLIEKDVGAVLSKTDTVLIKQTIQKDVFGRIKKASQEITPEEYLLRQGVKIQKVPKSVIGESLGKFYPAYSKSQTPTVLIRSKLPAGYSRQKVLAHEAFHYKTPLKIFNTPLEKLPYRFKPTELIATAGTKLYEKGLYKFKTRAPKIKVEPIILLEFGGTITEKGFYKALPKRQVLNLKPTTAQKLFGRDFSKTFMEGRLNIGGKVKAETFAVGTKIGAKDVFGTGLAKIKTTQPRTQRLFGVTGSARQVTSDFIKFGGTEVPIKVFEGVSTAKPLYTGGKMSLGKFRTTVIGQPSKTKELFSIKDIIPQVQIKSGSAGAFINAVYGDAPKIAETMKVTTKTVTKTPRLLAPQQLTPARTSVRSIPKEWMGVYDIPYTETVARLRVPSQALSLTPVVSQISISKQQTKVAESEIQKQRKRLLQAQKTQVKQLNKMRMALTQTQGLREMAKQMQGQQVKQLQGLKSLSRISTDLRITERPLKRPPKRPPVVPTPLKIPKPSSESYFGKTSKQYSKAYRLLIKRAGKYKPIGTFTKGKALKTGQQITRETLAATFKIEPTGKLIRGTSPKVKVSNIFRTYKIRGGKKVPLLGEFIQKRKTRLGTFGEVGEIQRAKRRKKRGK